MTAARSAADLAARGVACPACRGDLADGSDGLVCTECGLSYANDRLPILVPPASAFHATRDGDADGSYFSTLEESPIKRKIRRALPALGRDTGIARADRRLASALARTSHTDSRRNGVSVEPARLLDPQCRRRSSATSRCEEDGKRSRVKCVGRFDRRRGEKGGLETSAGRLRGFAVGAGERPGSYADRFPTVDWLVSDIDSGYGPDLIADAQHLPLADASQDVVIAEMVLEHVIDPGRAARELERVLVPGGWLLATTPFCFPWHGIPVDFQRFTPSGLIALFRRLDIETITPGMGRFSALAYQLDAALVNSAEGRGARRVSSLLSRLLAGGIKMLDRPADTRRAPSSRRLVGAAGLILLGQRREEARTDAEVLAEVRARFGVGP